MPSGFKLRIENLSDLVFGFALSIGGIALLNLAITDVGDVVRGLFWFTFSFLILIGMWMSYSKVMASVRMETAGAMYLNIGLLLLVVLEPYLLNLLAFDPSLDRDIATVIYAVDLAFIWLLMAGLYQVALRQGVEDATALRGERNIRIIHAAIFLISLLPFFWTTTIEEVEARYIIWFLAWPVGMAVERLLYPEAKLKTGEPV